VSVSPHGRHADSHLTDEEVFDAVDGALPQDRRRHLGLCSVCEVRVRELNATLALIQDVRVPEPSPLFWDHLSSRVAAANRERPRDPAAAPVALSWRRFWQFAVPCGAAVAALVMAVAITRPPRATGGRLSGVSARAEGEGATWRPGGLDLAGLLATGATDPLELVASVLSDEGDPSDVSAVSDTFVGGDAVERALAVLSDDEQRDLVDVLRRELGGRGA
jgi:hypothetical protein